MFNFENESNEFDLLKTGIDSCLYKAFVLKKMFNHSGKFIGPDEIKKKLLILMLINYIDEHELIDVRKAFYINFIEVKLEQIPVYISSFPINISNRTCLLHPFILPSEERENEFYLSLMRDAIVSKGQILKKQRM